jgi:hypothetical protein
MKFGSMPETSDASEQDSVETSKVNIGSGLWGYEMLWLKKVPETGWNPVLNLLLFFISSEIDVHKIDEYRTGPNTMRGFLP